MNVPTLHWGERTDLLEKHLAYVFSLDVTYTLDPTHAGPVANGLRLPIQAKPAEKETSIYHVLDEDLVDTVDGIVRDIPKARVVRGSDWMLLDDNGVINLNGRLLLETDAGASIWIQYGGVLRIPGLRARLHHIFGSASAPTTPPSLPDPLRGTAYVATRHESSQSKYRWLVQNQLVGFGKATATAASPAPPSDVPAGTPPSLPQWILDLSFDLYSAG